MSCFSKQTVHCMNCGVKHETNFQTFGGKVCSWECHDELGWKKTLSVMGKDPSPISEACKFNKQFYKTSSEKLQ